MTVPASWAKLTLFDRVLHTVQRRIDHDAARRLRAARPFVVTPRAALRLRDAMAANPELIAENAEFALPPFNPMWIEFPSRVMLEHARLSGEELSVGPTSDVNVGYLIAGNDVGVFAEGSDLQPESMPVSYLLHRPMTLNEQQVAAEWFEVSRIGLDPFLWGHNTHDSLDQEHQRMLRSQHTVRLNRLIEEMPYASSITRSNLYFGSAGELRNILALLLMINQPAKIIRTSTVPRQRGLVKGKVQAYWGHSLIDIDLDRKRRVNLLAKPKRGQANWHMRWHEVRGHFVHRNLGDGDHAHVWLPDEERDRRWRCCVPGCRALRTWREYPEGRGDATLGYVHQIHRIKTKEDA